MNADAQLLTGFLIGVAFLPAIVLLLRLANIRIEEGETVLVSRFGRLVGTLTTPGWHFLPDRIAPWLEIHRVSVRRQMRNLPSVVVNDASGTSVTVDVFLELRVVDPAKACFAVTDWERALNNVVSHAVLSVLANREFHDILTERTKLADEIRSETASETERWGIRIERLLLRGVTVSPDIAQQMLKSVAARLEREKANVVEAGRQAVAKLEAKTSAEIAVLIAHARAAYPAAIGKAFETVRKNQHVCDAYNELYALSLYHPDRTIAFMGFKENEIRHVDAAMLTMPSTTTTNGSK